MKKNKSMRKINRPSWEQLRRLVKLRVIVPTMRSPYPPQHSARGALVGLVWAMTPLVGAQMWLCLATWIIARKIFKWDFSLVISCAWTWVTNVFTMIPAYYIFYITGHYMLRPIGFSKGAAGDYSKFADMFLAAFSDSDMIGALKIFAQILFINWGLAMAVGCIPWAILSGWLGYRYSMKYTLARKARILARKSEKAE